MMDVTMKSRIRKYKIQYRSHFSVGEAGVV